MVGGSSPALAVRADSSSDVLYLRNGPLNWTSFGQQPPSVDGAWDLSVMDEHVVLMTSVGQLNLLTWNSLDINESSYHWNSLTFGDVTATGKCWVVYRFKRNAPPRNSRQHRMGRRSVANVSGC